MNWLERIWEYREDDLYPRLFGAGGVGIYPIIPEVLETAGLQDPRWSTCGVFKFGPSPSRPSWLYVSSGLSNAWFDEEPTRHGTSGFGCEFVLETTVDAVWPILRIHELMASEIGAACGRYPTWRRLGYYDRFPINKPIDAKSSRLTCFATAPPSGFPTDFILESGTARFLQLVGITAEEKAAAKSWAGEDLIERLARHGAFPIVDPARDSIPLA